MRDCTLIFLIKRIDQKVTEVCLAMKKRDFGKGRWNGVGGKVDGNESIESAAIRETEEEIGVKLEDMTKVAELAFTFAQKPDWNQRVHVYLSRSWTGEIVETEEMRPRWFDVGAIPYNEMWPDDIYF